MRKLETIIDFDTKIDSCDNGGEVKKHFKLSFNIGRFVIVVVHTCGNFG